jgi:hypothetical protein
VVQKLLATSMHSMMVADFRRSTGALGVLVGWWGVSD